MRKIKIFMLCAFLVFIPIGIVSANSTPVYWQGYPSWETMVVQKDCPVEVKGEELIFDFSTEQKTDYRIQGQVSASYQMVNPTDQSLTVQMAFPFISSLSQFNGEDVGIEVGGKPVSYEVYMGEEWEEDHSLEDILPLISKRPYQSESFQQDEIGKWYRIDVRPTSNQTVEVQVDINVEGGKRKFLTYGFHSYGRKEDQIRISSSCHQDATMEVYVIGEQLDLDIKVFSAGEENMTGDLVDYDISTQEMALGSYVMDYVERNIQSHHPKGLMENQEYNLYAKTLDGVWLKNNNFATEEDFIVARDRERVFVLLYTVEFPSKSQREVQVKYVTTTTMDKRKTEYPTYTIHYFLSPAQHWENFQDLQIKIIPSEENPYIVDSNMDFVREVDNTYQASFDTLPREDLTFTLYSEEKVTLGDKVRGSFKKHFGYFAPFIIIIVVLILLAILFFIHQKRKGVKK